MARSQARIHTSVWRNRDFTALPASAQATYWMVLAQADVNMAGVVAYMPDRWASFRGDPHRLHDDLETLERGDFIIIDRDTHETWIRTFAKNDGALRSPTNRKSMWTAWTGVLSTTIRRRFLEQLDGVTVALDNDQVGVIDEALRQGWISSEDVREARSHTPSTPPSDGVPDGVPHPPPDTPSTPHAETDETDTPPHTPPDRGPRARLPASSTSSSTTGGRAREDDAPPPDPDRPPDSIPRSKTWDHAWARMRKRMRYAKEDDRRPPLDDELAAVLTRIDGGMHALRNADGDRAKWIFRDAWRDLHLVDHAQEPARG